MAQNWSLEQLAGECSEMLDKCAALSSREVTFQFPDGRKAVSLFNWASLVERMDAGDEAANEEASRVAGLMSEHAAEQIEDPQVPKWVPFGIVRDAGVLFFDMLSVHGGQPTVLWEDPSQKRIELGLADAFFKTLQE